MISLIIQKNIYIEVDAFTEKLIDRYLALLPDSDYEKVRTANNY